MRLDALAFSSELLGHIRTYHEEHIKKCKVDTILGEVESNYQNFESPNSFNCMLCNSILLYKLSHKAANLKKSVIVPLSRIIDDIPSQQDVPISDFSDYTEIIHHISALILQSIDETVRIIRLFGPENVYVSFNGGKDSTVAMHLYLCAYCEYFRLNRVSGDVPSPKMIFFKEEGGFSEINDFVTEMAEKYSFELKVVNECWKTGITSQFDERNNIAFVMGSRKTDAGMAEMESLKCSGLDKTSFLLVNVVKDWSYGAIWAFILHFKIPYCSLYDRGYTSIGKISDTEPNEELRDGSGYKQAHLLADWNKERNGRKTSKPAESIPKPPHPDTKIHSVINPLFN